MKNLYEKILVVRITPQIKTADQSLVDSHSITSQAIVFSASLPLRFLVNSMVGLMGVCVRHQTLILGPLLELDRTLSE